MKRKRCLECWLYFLTSLLPLSDLSTLCWAKLNAAFKHPATRPHNLMSVSFRKLDIPLLASIPDPPSPSRRSADLPWRSTPIYEAKFIPPPPLPPPPSVSRIRLDTWDLAKQPNFCLVTMPRGKECVFRRGGAREEKEKEEKKGTVRRERSRHVKISSHNQPSLPTARYNHSFFNFSLQ